jgi:hypothetical protein
MIPSGTYRPSDNTRSGLRNSVLIRQSPLIPGWLNVSPNAISTSRCSTMEVAGLSPVIPLSHIVPTSVPAMPNRLTVLLMLFSPVTQPIRVVTGTVTTAAGATAATLAEVNEVVVVVLSSTTGTALSVSRRAPQASSAKAKGDPAGTTGEFGETAPSPMAASMPDSTLVRFAGAATGAAGTAPTTPAVATDTRAWTAWMAWLVETAGAPAPCSIVLTSP